MAFLQYGCGSAWLMPQSGGNTWSTPSRCTASLLCGCEGESLGFPCGWTLDCTQCSGRGCSPAGTAAVWSSCFPSRAADRTAGDFAGTGRSAAAASWAGGTPDHSACRCKHGRHCGWSLRGLHKPAERPLGWEMHLPAGECLGSPRKGREDLCDGREKKRTRVGIRMSFKDVSP